MHIISDLDQLFKMKANHIITLTKSGISYQIQLDIPHKTNL